MRDPSLGSPVGPAAAAGLDRRNLTQVVASSFLTTPEGLRSL